MSFRTILFISNNFPPISCGVGDYTYKLSKALVKQGIEVSILCSSKPEIIASINAFKKEGIKVMPIVRAWNKNGLRSLIKDFRGKKYEWVSLQYVPFSFQPKGLPFGLTQGLNMLFPTTKWHIMFHELWVGKVSNPSLRFKILGYVQKLLIKNMLKALCPEVIHSHSEIYLFQLKNMGYASKKLSLFSNIDLNEFLSKKNQNSEHIVFTIFGGIINSAPVQDFLEELNELLQVDNNKKIKFNFLGNNGGNLNFWISELNRLGISYHIYGFLPENEISKILFNSDYGISTTPYLLTEKSGALAAMKQHGLRVICVSRNWQIPWFDRSQIKESLIKEYRKDNLSNILFTNWAISDYKDANTIALQLINDLDSE